MSHAGVATNRARGRGARDPVGSQPGPIHRATRGDRVAGFGLSFLRPRSGLSVVGAGLGSCATGPFSSYSFHGAGRVRERWPLGAGRRSGLHV